MRIQSHGWIPVAVNESWSVPFQMIALVYSRVLMPLVTELGPPGQVVKATLG